MAHRNARLTPVTRLELVLEVEAGWSQAEVARRFRVSRPTVAKWVRRFREAGADGLEGRNSAPHRHPRRTAPELEQRICAVRRSEGFGPHRIAWALDARPAHRCGSVDPRRSPGHEGRDPDGFAANRDGVVDELLLEEPDGGA